MQHCVSKSDLALGTRSKQILKLDRYKHARSEHINGLPVMSHALDVVRESATLHIINLSVNGGPDETRTRDLRRDRPAF